jgi:primary-amine oxidase
MFRRAARPCFFGLIALALLVVLNRGDRGDASLTQDEPPARKAAQAAETPRKNVVRQGFPARKASEDLTKSETAWEIEWDLTSPDNRPMAPPGCTMRIKTAKFMWKNREGKPQWVTVVRMLELSEIFVPYDNGWTAFLDIHDMPFYTTRARKEFLGPSCVLPGEILKSSNPSWSETVHKEVHDDGIRWMSAETDDNYQIADKARRGEKLLLWSCYYGANYRYLIEYGFGDDGMITCRVGPTGRNLMNRQDDFQDTHLHVGCWRMEFDLGDPIAGTGGPKDNDILLARRVFDETSEKFTQLARPFNKNGLGQACEGGALWKPEEFTSIRVQSKVRKNSHGKPIAFDLLPLRWGAIRQMQPRGGAFASNMDFVNQDFWVTRTESGFTSYSEVPQYASQKRTLQGFPTTVWHITPALHFPRGEDFGSEDGKSSYEGSAITTWATFTIKPRDVFDSTPLHKASPNPFRFRE